MIWIPVLAHQLIASGAGWVATHLHNIIIKQQIKSDLLNDTTHSDSNDSESSTSKSKNALRTEAPGADLEADLEGVHSNPPPPHVFDYHMKLKSFGLSETKLFHFMGFFKKH